MVVVVTAAVRIQHAAMPLTCCAMPHVLQESTMYRPPRAPAVPHPYNGTTSADAAGTTATYHWSANTAWSADISPIQSAEQPGVLQIEAAASAQQRADSATAAPHAESAAEFIEQQMRLQAPGLTTKGGIGALLICP